MKILIAGHICLDIIRTTNGEFNSLGGPPCYSGLTAKALQVDVAVATKFGPDLGDDKVLWLSRNGLQFTPSCLSSKRPTTRFFIDRTQNPRRLRLISRCEDLQNSQITYADGDAALVSPIAGEIPIDTLAAISKRYATVYIDPQGFLRSFSENGTCRLSESNVDLLGYADIIKMDPDEARLILHEDHSENRLALISREQSKILILTSNDKEIIMYARGKRYIIRPRVYEEVRDTTGLGDIFAGAFLAQYMTSKDPVWSICVASSAARLATRHTGISKIPTSKEILRAARAVSKGVKR